jgi:hypothetical protein
VAESVVGVAGAGADGAGIVATLLALAVLAAEAGVELASVAGGGGVCAHTASVSTPKNARVAPRRWRGVVFIEAG